MKPISHNIKTTKNVKKKDKILSGDGKEKTEEEILEQEEKNILNKINNGLFSENLKSKLIYINLLKNDIEKMKNNDFHKESNLLKDIYEPKYYEMYNIISDIVCAKDSSLFRNKLTEEDYQKYNISINPEVNEETLEYEPIENFWLNAIENTCYFKVSEEDKKILKFLIKIHSNLIINNEMGDTYKVKKLNFRKLIGMKAKNRKILFLICLMNKNVNWKKAEVKPILLEMIFFRLF